MPSKSKVGSSKEALYLLRKICKEEGIRVYWYRPLAIGIYHDLKARLGDRISTRDLYRALRFHTKSHAYLDRLVAGAQRFNLEGRITGVVTEEEAKLAKKERYKLHRRLINRRPSKSGDTPTPSQPKLPKPALREAPKPKASPTIILVKKKRVIPPTE